MDLEALGSHCRGEGQARYSARELRQIDIEEERAFGTACRGTAVFLTSQPEATPPALLHNLKHNHVLHENNVILTVRTENTPTVPADERGTFQLPANRVVEMGAQMSR